MFTGRRQRGRYFCVQFNHLAPRMRYATSANPRTCSAANVGVDKDSEHRQRAAVGAYARRAGFEVVAEFYDAAVSGADPIQDRPGFAALLDRIEDNGVRTVIVEDASRFARQLMAQELGIALLVKRGVRAADGQRRRSHRQRRSGRNMMRQVAGAFAEYEKARLVGKLRAARDRIRKERGKCEGRKAHAEINPDAVALAKRLRRANPKTGERMSLRDFSAELKAAGYVNARGLRLNPNSIKSMVERKAAPRSWAA